MFRKSQPQLVRPAYLNMSRIQTILLVKEKGVEPLRPCGHRILSAARLPVPPFFLKGAPSSHDGSTRNKKNMKVVVALGFVDSAGVEPASLRRRTDAVFQPANTYRPGKPPSLHSEDGHEH